MQIPRIVVGIVSLVLITLGAGTSLGQAFPSKPISIITVEAGGGGDLVTRLIANGIAGPLGQSVTVDNRTETIAIELVAKAAPDGYTLLAFGSPIWTRPLLQKTSYDPVRDFAPLTLATMAPLIVVVHPSLAATSIKELIALAKAKPGELKYALGINGSSSQLTGALFTYMAGVNIVAVPYKTGPLGLADLIADKVQMMVPSAGTVMPAVKSGKLRALAVTSAQPSALVPGLPPVAAAVPGYEAVQSIVMFAPAKTPAPVIARLNQEIVRVLKTADAKQRLLDAGLESVGSTPQQLAATMKSEMERLGKVIKEAGIHAN